MPRRTFSESDKITRGEERLAVATWAKRLGTSPSIILRRLERGWLTRDAVTIPPGGRRRKTGYMRLAVPISVKEFDLLTRVSDEQHMSRQLWAHRILVQVLDEAWTIRNPHPSESTTESIDRMARQKLTLRTSIPMTPADYEHVRKAATQEGMLPATYMREVILQALEQRRTAKRKKPETTDT